MEEIVIRISGMRGVECVRAVANAIQDLPSIGQVELSLESGQARVEHGRFVTPDDILQAIAEAGYDAELG